MRVFGRDERPHQGPGESGVFDARGMPRASLRVEAKRLDKTLVVGTPCYAAVRERPSSTSGKASARKWTHLF